MKAQVLIEQLQNYLKQYPDLEVTFKLIPNDGTEWDTDRYDQNMECVGCLSTSTLQDFNELELGFQIKG